MNACHLPVPSLAAIAVALYAVNPIHAQPSPVPRTDCWRPDGPVHALAVDGDTAYLGGAFHYLGPASGGAGLVWRADAGPAGAFPALDGDVLAMVPDGAGGWFVGGNFTERATGQARLVHVDAGGSLDLFWRPEVVGTLRALLVHGASLYAAGDITRVDGEERTGIIRFDFPGGRLASWRAAANGSIHALALDESRLYAGGTFTSFGGRNRARIAAVDLRDGSVAEFNPGASGSGSVVRALAVSGTTLYVGGEFTTCGGKPRTRLAALGTLAGTGSALDWNPGAGGTVYCLAVDGPTIYAGGDFSSAGGANRTRLVALDAGSNAARAGWEPAANGIVHAILAGPEGPCVVGAFTTLAGQARPGAGRLDAATGAVLSWAPRISVLASSGSPVVHAIASAGDRVALGGAFASLGGVARMHLAAVDLSSGVPTAWGPGASGEVLSLAVGGETLFAGGSFTNIAGVARARLAALDRATGEATPFDANVAAKGTDGVAALLLAGSRLYLGGSFTAVGGLARPNLAEVEAATGSVNTQWNPAPNGSVLALALSGTNLYVGGSFASIGGSNRTFLAVVSTAGIGRATPVQPRADNDVRALAMAGDRLYVGGDFDNVGGAPRRRFALVDAGTGVAVPAWNPEVTSPSGAYHVRAVAVSGRAAYVGGVFTTAGGEFRSRIAGIDLPGAVATVWNPGANGTVRVLAYQPGRLVAGGDFTRIGEAPVGYFAVFQAQPFIPGGGLRMLPDGAAEIEAWEGDVPATTLSLQASDAAAGCDWIDLATEPVTGRPKTFRDPASSSASARASRIYRVVAR